MIPGFGYMFRGASTGVLPDGRIPGLPPKLGGPVLQSNEGLPIVVQAPTNEPLTVTNTRLRSATTGQYMRSNPPAPGIPVAQVAPPGATIGAPTALQNNVNNLQQSTPQPLPQTQVAGSKSPIPLPPTGPIPAIIELAKAIRDKSPSALARSPVLYGLFRTIADPGPQVGYGVDVLFPFTEEFRHNSFQNVFRIGVDLDPNYRVKTLEQLQEKVIRIEEPDSVMTARDGA